MSVCYWQIRAGNIIAFFVSIVRIVFCNMNNIYYRDIDSGTMLQKSKLLGVCIKNVHMVW